MSTLQDLRIRIRGVKSTQKITAAMKMVAAAKLRRSQERVEAVRPYEREMKGMLSHLLHRPQELDSSSLLMKGRPEVTTHLLVVVSADRGLCGGFNSALVREAKTVVRALQSQGKDVKILCRGRKGRELLRQGYGEMMIDLPPDGSKAAQEEGKEGFEDALDFANQLQSRLENAEFGEASILFTVFHSALRQEVAHHDLIPFPVAPWEGPGKTALYAYEPKPDALLAHLLPRYLAVQLYRVFLENSASEHGARMTAMDNATRNAKEMIKKLQLSYNQIRQAYITKELIEIISGAEAV